MTTRKLTPAEVLELLRDMETMRPEQLWAKWPTDIGNVFPLARAALEEALAQKPPAAPVPSDEEIVDAIESARLIYGQTMGTRALRLLARRIGVQGVPQ